MNINRHNYEEYFILYMDNELGGDDRRMVEEFVQQHPDLKEELDLLFQYKLTPDTEVIFPGKEELMKVNGNTPVTLTNYEEWLMLYIDNELTADQKKEVEQLIAVNPLVKKEFELLQHTKLHPEKIIFTAKESLYKKEEKVRRIFSRWTAAAILILALSLAAVIVFKNKKAIVEPGIATTVPGPEKKIVPVKTNTATNPNSPVVPEGPGNAVKETAVINSNTKKDILPDVKQENKNFRGKNNNLAVVKNNNQPANIPIPENKNEIIVAVNSNDRPTNNLPKPLTNPNINKSYATNTSVAKVNTPDLQESKITAPVTTKTTQPSDIVNASFKDDADLDQSDGKKSKLRGFFRKLTRTFEKRTNIEPSDDGKLLVAGLSIKLK